MGAIGRLAPCPLQGHNKTEIKGLAKVKDRQKASGLTMQITFTEKFKEHGQDKMKLDLFCKIIDNFGDAGVCLRLCRELTKLGAGVRFFCDDLNTLKTIADPSDLKNQSLLLAPWPDPKNYDPASRVVAAFSCRFDPPLISKFEEKPSTLVNLEYLTAEDFASDLHLKPSPLYKCPCYFFFPGFTKQSGGLNYEQSFKDKVLKSLKPALPQPGESFKVSWFSYKHPKIFHLFESFKRCPFPFEILTFEGYPLKTLNALYGLSLKPGDSFQDGNLRFKAAPMVSQIEYDDILLHSHLNLVRGEDSIVRALLCGRPFLWHIYPQDEDAHIVKLKAFLKVFKDVGLDKGDPSCSLQEQTADKFAKLCLAYNRDLSMAADFDLAGSYESWCEICTRASLALLSRPSLACNLLGFYRSLEQGTQICYNTQIFAPALFWSKVYSDLG